MSEGRRSYRDSVEGGLVAQLPLVLVVLSMFVLVLSQTVQAIRDHGSLSEFLQGQEQTLQEATKLRQQLELLAGKTAQLAASGDAGAKNVVETMKRQGVTLSPPKQ